MKTVTEPNGGDFLVQPAAAEGPGPRVGPPSERGQKKLAALIAKGRVEPILRDLGSFQLQTGWQRKGASRKGEKWSLRTPRPWQAPRAVQGLTEGARRVRAERQRQLGAEGFDAARDDQYIKRELANAGRCYSLYAIKQVNPGDDFKEFVEHLLKWWPWDRAWWKPSEDPIRNREKAGALYWAEAERMKRRGDTGHKFDAMIDAADSEADQIDKLLKDRRCPHDSDGDGNCHLCAKSGVCQHKPAAPAGGVL